MLLTLLDRMGEWNPQLFRELKGRLKPRNFLLTGAVSLVGQFLLLLIASDEYTLGWHIQWQIVFRCLDWMLPFILLVGSVYMLIGDLAKEEHRGTLNFIRLSPQSSENILLGKMLGVPALLYLAIALAIPLHAVSALALGMPLNWLLGVYTLWGAAWCLFCGAALLITFLTGRESESKSLAGAGSTLAALFGLLYISVVDISFDAYRTEFGLGDWKWFLLPLDNQALLAYVWAIITLSTATYWIWQAVNRRFRNPNATLLSKQQSYWLVAGFEFWLLGFVVTEFNSVDADFYRGIGYGFLFMLNPFCFLLLTAILSPGRQALQDWSRYRRSRAIARKNFWNRSLVQDLIWGEKSPALLAIAINLAIAAIIWVPWILLWHHNVSSQENFQTPQALMALLLTMNVILIYACIAELMVFIKTQQRQLWAAGTLGTIFLPMILLTVLSITPEKHPFLWLLSAFPAIGLQHASVTSVFLALLGQWGVLGLLSLQLTRQLRQVGESASKTLLAGHPSSP
ncbi:MAG: hypothetical protein KME08_16725 [Aphanothece sp. CMT-3BRIN-NPC111]|nr:hypothetical protein [Aphanothece sp. CMT-3BRIN-NPC111]